MKQSRSNDPGVSSSFRVDGSTENGGVQTNDDDDRVIPRQQRSPPSAGRVNVKDKMVAVVATRTLERKGLKEVKRPILTAIDESIVVSLVCFRAVTPLLEVD